MRTAPRRPCSRTLQRPFYSRRTQVQTAWLHSVPEETTTPPCMQVHAPAARPEAVRSAASTQQGMDMGQLLGAPSAPPQADHSVVRACTTGALPMSARGCARSAAPRYHAGPQPPPMARVHADPAGALEPHPAEPNPPFLRAARPRCCRRQRRADVPNPTHAPSHSQLCACHCNQHARVVGEALSGGAGQLYCRNGGGAPKSAGSGAAQAFRRLTQHLK